MKSTSDCLDRTLETTATPCAAHQWVGVFHGAEAGHALMQCPCAEPVPDPGELSPGPRLWQMEELEEPQAFARAVEAAGNAETIVIVALADDELPPVLWIWLEHVLQSDRKAPVNLKLLLGTAEFPQPIGCRTNLQMEALAKQTGCDCKLNWFHQVTHRSSGPLTDTEFRARGLTGVLEGILTTPPTPHFQAPDLVAASSRAVA